MDRRLQEENEKKKEYLKSYQRAVKRERDILEEIKRLRADKMFPSVVNDGMPKGSSQSDLSDYIAILDEQIELLKKERLKKVQQYRKIENQIRKMHTFLHRIQKIPCSCDLRSVVHSYRSRQSQKGIYQAQ